jgi:hypothetical protein
MLHHFYNLSRVGTFADRVDNAFKLTLRKMSSSKSGNPEVFKTWFCMVRFNNFSVKNLILDLCV